METAAKEILKIEKTNWTPVKFGDVVFEPKENAKDIYNESIEHVVGLEHIDSENIHLTRAGILEETTTFSKKFRMGDVLFGRRRAYLKKAALASFNGICSGDITVFRAKKNLLPELLPFIVNNEKFFDYAVKHSAGGLSPRVKFKDLANYEFFLPPKDQQAQLAELLWAMDEVVENHTACSALITRLINSFLVSLPETETKNLVECGFAIIDGDRGANYPNSSEFYGEEDGYCLFLNAGNVTKKGFDFSKIQFISSEKDHLLRKGKLKKGDIILTTRGTVGNFAFYNHSVPYENIRINSGMVIIRNSENLVNTDLFYALCKNGYLSSEIEKRAYGTAQPQLSVKIISKLRAPLFSDESSDKILKELEYLEKSLEDTMVLVNSSKALQKSLINQVF